MHWLRSRNFDLNSEAVTLPLPLAMDSRQVNNTNILTMQKRAMTIEISLQRQIKTSAVISHLVFVSRDVERINFLKNLTPNYSEGRDVHQMQSTQLSTQSGEAKNLQQSVVARKFFALHTLVMSVEN